MVLTLKELMQEQHHTYKCRQKLFIGMEIPHKLKWFRSPKLSPTTMFFRVPFLTGRHVSKAQVACSIGHELGDDMPSEYSSASQDS